MIIGESDQRLSSGDTNYYEAPQKFEVVLKRKFSGENQNCESFSDRSMPSEPKMTHYVDVPVGETYQIYQQTEIHQEDGQSYINLTVMAPTSSAQSNHHHQQQQQQQQQQTTANYTTNNQNQQRCENNKSTNNKFDVRNYQQQQHQQNGKRR